MLVRLALPCFVGGLVVLAAACSGKVEGVPAPGNNPDGSVIGTPTGTGTGSQPPVVDGSTSTDAGLPSDDAGSGTCETDQDCNTNPAMSAMLGTCFHGLCLCNEGSVIQRTGKCDRKEFPDCQTQGGRCQSIDAKCKDGELASAEKTNASCGDLVPAVCCNTASGCKGPTAKLVCCGPAGGSRPPICVNGWQQCPAGHTPVAEPGKCR